MSAKPQARASARTARTRAARATLPEGERGRSAPLQESIFRMPESSRRARASVGERQRPLSVVRA
eukprot:13280659-Alexandrium_andersonii.AAC.1